MNQQQQPEPLDVDMHNDQFNEYWYDNLNPNNPMSKLEFFTQLTDTNYTQLVHV